MKKERKSDSKLEEFIQARRKKNNPTDPGARIHLAIQISELCNKLKNACSINLKK